MREGLGEGLLFHNTFLQILGQVHLADRRCSLVGSDLLHVVLHHPFNQLLEGGRLRIPAQFSFGLAGIAP